MNLPQNKTLLRWILIITAFLVVALILWNTNVFFQQFKQEERIKMEVIAEAIKNMNSPDLDRDITLEGKIIASNTNIPMILTDEDGKIDSWGNLNVERKNSFEGLATDERMYLTRQLEVMKSENQPLYIRDFETK